MEVLDLGGGSDSDSRSSAGGAAGIMDYRKGAGTGPAHRRPSDPGAVHALPVSLLPPNADDWLFSARPAAALPPPLPAAGLALPSGGAGGAVERAGGERVAAAAAFPGAWHDAAARAHAFHCGPPRLMRLSSCLSQEGHWHAAHATFSGTWAGALVAVRVFRHASGGAAPAVLQTRRGQLLGHPNVVRVFAFRTDPVVGDPAAFVSGCMRRAGPDPCAGPGPDPGPAISLSAALARAGAPAPEAASAEDLYETVVAGAMSPQPSSAAGAHVLSVCLLTLLEVGRALAYLHAAGVAHGHVCASNVLLRGCRRDRRGFIALLGNLCVQPRGRAALPAERPAMDADVSAFGALMMDMVAGQEFGDTPAEACAACAPAYAGLSIKCRLPDAQQRPSMAEVIAELTGMRRALLRAEAMQDIDAAFAGCGGAPACGVSGTRAAAAAALPA
ncbi:hypothetical protein WJX81_000040 [Elliptochloris bilobata]|uniref:Protein kinase domain-containing protein n=1 Tax=Elliptochloris bilobata TaxID=381761 RepID=A0AAW1QUM4_9CHLO